jgi:hypothetical protein
MEQSCFRARFRGQFVARVLLTCCLFLLIAAQLTAQSTFGAILGTVRDSSGALVIGAQVSLVNTGTTGTRTTATDASGSYAFKNIDVGTYTLTITAPGFEKESLPAIGLTARETRRMDATLNPGAETQTVVVNEDAAPVITTDVSSLAQTKIGEELVDLPVAIYSRSAGSTSPISTLTTEAGVQTDDSGNLAVMGTTAALLSVTIDGISSVGVEYSGPVNEMFPSFNSIEEIRVSESNNNAEFSGVADITTVSKAGTSHFHGGVFENHENSVFNSDDAFSNSKPKIIMNDFGGTLGGPLSVPHLFNGRDKTFFFISFEGLRLPRETPILLSVPSTDMRNGNLTAYLAGQQVSAINQPDGTPIDPSHVPVSAISANLLTYLMPAPNYGQPGDYANNYQINFPSPISANQGDVRLDRTLSSKQTVFARFSYKNRQVTTAPSAACTFTYCAEAGSPLQGAYNTPEIDEGLTFAHNYVFTPNLLNEFRGGFNAQHTSETQSYSTASLLGQTGLTVPQPDLEWSEAPQVLINGFMSTGAGNPGMQRGQIIQALDNVSWTHANHSFKFGADFKRISDHDDNVYGNYRSGWYVFNGSTKVTGTIGDPFTAFLLGYPDYTEVSSTAKPAMDGLGYSWAFFGQDDWKITHQLTLNLGLRYELHPPMRETNGNTAVFEPNYSATIGGQLVNGAVVVPNAQALTFASPDFVNAIAPTPILTAQQAGIPDTLRFTDKTGWGPRLGFAWRVLGSDKTVLRGGWGRFIETPLGFSLVAGWAVDASYLATYDQEYGADLVTPLLSFANPFNPLVAESTGTASFDYAFPIHYKLPTVQQWNLTLEQDLGHGIGVRGSYTGSHGANLDAMVDLNQVPANTVGYANDSGAIPFPSWAVIQSVQNAAESNYNGGSVEVSRRSGKSITFDASYMFTRDLSNAGGATPNAFAVAGGSFLTDRFNPHHDYGNVIYDRRHRFLATYLWALPFGHGQRWLSSRDALNRFVGDWQLGGITILQSGPFLTPTMQTVDPANTNILTTVGQTRPDQLTSGSLYAQQRTTRQWLNPDAFPYKSLAVGYGTQNQIGIGRFGNAPVGGVIGPGTANFSLSLMKSVAVTERAQFQFSAAAANVFNHRNYEPPNMQVDASAGFGSITALQSAEGAGPRNLELSGRFTF